MVERREMSENALRRVEAESLRAFCVSAFEALNVPTADAEITTDVLLAASLRGVDSHGVGQLRRYVRGLQDGPILARPKEKVIRETATTALVDAGAGLGQPVSYRAMRRAIEKATQHGVGFVTVRNSNHYGIAGYYAMMALEHGMIGIALTNADAWVVPTFGRVATLGTNPIAVAAPAGQEHPFVLDMATSVVAVGKVRLAQRQGKPIPEGWALDETGAFTTDPEQVMNDRPSRRPGGVLPLGGVGELLGSHKGYGLALMVEILCGVLPGAACLDQTYPRTPAGEPLPADLGHFFGALRVSAFRPLDEFKAAMDDIIRRLKGSPKADGAGRIYIAGEKEFEEAQRRSREGIPTRDYEEADWRRIAAELGIAYNETRSAGL